DYYCAIWHSSATNFF
nr:immunoglobulin light chain junction region [Macaca mulatta]MOX79123.1 immunoglobulin light chain junction region [Macaca mulatta]MOX80768.1 immunoglobulin light chain junction region [Macaca mulatta]MOX80784.1 immunoglobulin light chain junction region [Macaca mulatta]MOX81168.1 immunoglobulin light chain junction region [Macaca mulatta]